jgi:hypothetical protein
MSSRFKSKDNDPNGKERDEKKVDTKYYDELFKKIKDQEAEEFNDPESIGNRNLHLSIKLKIKLLF